MEELLVQSINIQKYKKKPLTDSASNETATEMTNLHQLQSSLQWAENELRVLRLHSQEAAEEKERLEDQLANGCQQ